MHSSSLVSIFTFVALLFLAQPTQQASIWTAPGAHSPLSDTAAAAATPPRSLFRVLRDGIIETIWPRPEGSPPSRHQHHRDGSGAPSTAPELLLEKYGDDMVLRFELDDDEQRRALSEAADTLFLDVWHFGPRWADIRLSKDMVDPLHGLLPRSIKSKPLIHNLAQAVHDSQVPASAAEEQGSGVGAAGLLGGKSVGGGSGGSGGSGRAGARSNPVFERYQPLSVIVPWMRLLQSMFGTHVRVFEIGKSFEGRGIPAIRVGSHPHNAERRESARKTIVAVGGQHAREWISTAAVNYAAYEMITAYGKDRRVTQLIEEFDFVFVPTLNPDGYVHSWERDRLWRKTRQTTRLGFCPGLDLDRSFGFAWDGESTRGNPCSESYAGEAAFSAREAAAFADWMRNETTNPANNARIVGFLDLHSYSQQILYPYSYTCDRAPPAYEDLQELAIGLQKAMHTTNGKLYTVASACDATTGYNSSSLSSADVGSSSGGSALDWVHEEAAVRYSYQIKLPDTGSYGFLLPARDIVPTGRELYNALTYLAEWMLSPVKMDDDREGETDEESQEKPPSAREPVFKHGPARAGSEVTGADADADTETDVDRKADDPAAENELDRFISDELDGIDSVVDNLDDEPVDPGFELRRRR